MEFFAFVGFAMSFIGAIKLVIDAFKVSVLWGLGCLLFSPISLVFLVLHWQEAKSSFFLFLSGIAIVLLIGVTNGEVTWRNA